MFKAWSRWCDFKIIFLLFTQWQQSLQRQNVVHGVTHFNSLISKSRNSAPVDKISCKRCLLLSAAFTVSPLNVVLEARNCPVQVDWPKAGIGNPSESIWLHHLPFFLMQVSWAAVLTLPKLTSWMWCVILLLSIQAVLRHAAQPCSRGTRFDPDLDTVLEKNSQKAIRNNFFNYFSSCPLNKLPICDGTSSHKKLVERDKGINGTSHDSY